MQSLQIYQDANGTHFTNIITASDNINHLMLSANVEQTFIVPNEADYCIFQSFNEFYVNLGATATVPNANVINGSGSIPVPLGLFVRPGEVLHVISAESNARVTLMFFKRG